MNLKLAIAGLVALGGIALGAGSASAVPNGLSVNGQVGQSGNVEQVRLVCDAYGRCWRRPNYAYGYVAPRYYGGGPRFYGGPRRYGYRGGYGYGRRW